MFVMDTEGVKVFSFRAEAGSQSALDLDSILKIAESLENSPWK